MRRFFIILLATFSFFVAAPAFAIAVDEEVLENPEDEARAIALMKEIRCLKCQNQSIFDSEAGIAQDLRKIVREHVKAGDTDQEIKALLTSSYGDWVLLKPPVGPRTYLLWLAPAILLLLGGLLVFAKIRRVKAAATEKPLSGQEKAKIKKLLSGNNKS